MAIQIHKKVLEKSHSHIKSISTEFKKQVSTAIMTAFGLVIALAWKDLITALIPSFSSAEMAAKYPYLIQLLGAIIITVVAVIGILIVAAWSKKE
jgi:hypothetical protein